MTPHLLDTIVESACYEAMCVQRDAGQVLAEAMVAQRSARRLLASL